jgi:membrane-associated phospholipid phosphatase
VRNASVGRRIRLPAGRRDLFKQIAIWLGFVVSYETVSNLAGHDSARALGNGLRVVRLELATGHGLVELDLQHWLTSSHWLTTLAAWTYWNSEFTVVGLALAWVYLFRHRSFTRFRNTLLIADTIGLLGYFLLPTMPPRLLPGFGFVDTLHHVGGPDMNSGLLRIATNEYAAMPSLHAADAAIVGVTLALLVSSRPLRVAWLLWPAWVAFCVMATANHYALDVVAGVAVAAAAAAIVRYGELPRFLSAPTEVTAEPAFADDPSRA